MEMSSGYMHLKLREGLCAKGTDEFLDINRN